MEGNGQTRKSSFCANVERFIEEYPKEVNDLASQTFLSVVTTPSEEELLFKNLRLYKATDQWIRGIVPAAKTWLSEGSWKVAPKNPAQQSETPFWKEPV